MPLPIFVCLFVGTFVILLDGLGFNSQNPHSGSQLLLISVLGDLTISSGYTGTRHAHDAQTYKQAKHTEKKIFLKRELYI